MEKSVKHIMFCGSVSVDEIAWPTYMKLRENGWVIRGAICYDPATKRDLNAPKSRKPQSEAKKVSKDDASKKGKPGGLGKPRSKRGSKATRLKKIEVPLSREAVARIRQSEPFQVQRIAPAPDGPVKRPGFFIPKGNATINWNDTSEDSDQWER